MREGNEGSVLEATALSSIFSILLCECLLVIPNVTGAAALMLPLVAFSELGLLWAIVGTATLEDIFRYR